MKIHHKNKSNKRLFFLLALGIVVAVGGYFVWTYFASNSTPSAAEPTEDTSIQDDRTYTDTTEGQEVTVPDNVDPSSIKNYALVTENETFKIRELDGEYYITLYAIINRPDQSDMYRDQLRQYKQAALNYLEEQNINTTQVKIHYEPGEATNL